MSQENHKYTNALIDETSPYLLQHAHNPVDWMPWGEAALAKAKAENKPLLISIGYSACHWCHVMEHESFEDTAVARVMNENFICIKVDREERPDVDDIYMTAVQLMNNRGGWPLNAFATPEGKPFFGGTYFPKSQWLSVLDQLSDVYQNDPKKVTEYSEKLTGGIAQSDQLIAVEQPDKFDEAPLTESVTNWKTQFDNQLGGPNRAPKFPLPNNYQFLLRYGFLFEDQQVLDHVELTLKEMAFGGIYDQIGGGFARYSVDEKWKVPHFEKMLYDNAQLVSLYSEAYRWNKSRLYKKTVYETVNFIERELMDKSGAFYSALDADSEGEEGKFYVWTKEEMQAVLGEDYQLAAEFFNVNAKGLWEGNYILLRTESLDKFYEKQDLSMKATYDKIEEIKSKLIAARSKRVRPGLDDKSLTSWNGLMLAGLCDAYLALGDEKFLKLALTNANFLVDNQIKSDGSIWHSYKDGRSTIEGFLEDYCFVAEGFIKLYEATFDEQWLVKANELTQYAITHFSNESNGMFYFTKAGQADLIARKMEINDNVIPASNSAMAKVLWQLGTYYQKEDYLNRSTQMLANVIPRMADYGSSYSNWGLLYLHQIKPSYEVAILGEAASDKKLALLKSYYPNLLLMGGDNEDSLPLLEQKLQDGRTMIYVCENKSCQLPTEEVEKAVELMGN